MCDRRLSFDNQHHNLWMTHKRHGTVVGEQLLNTNAPVFSGNQSAVGSMRLAQEANPRVLQLQQIKRPQTHQDVQAVFAVRPADGEEKTKLVSICGLLSEEQK